MAEIGERRTANYTTSESLKKKIEVAKYAAKDKYAICRSSARKLVSAYEALVAAEELRVVMIRSKSVLIFAEISLLT